MLVLGEKIGLSSNRTALLSRVIGEGAEGTVFEVELDDGSAPQALKWLFPHISTPEKQAAIEDLVRRGAPGDRFVWPAEVVRSDDGFGYLMPLVPRHCVKMSALLRGRVAARSAVRTTLCRDLADSFLGLHSQGLCYRDISFANVFLDPGTGRPFICDNDNVAIDEGGPSPVLGTRKFMAPEIVRGEADPSIHTDLWSLSVLLFYVLVVGHPLLGNRELGYASWDEEAESDMFGHNPVFIFDPNDDSNRPDPSFHRGVQANWNHLTTDIRGLFTQAFTRGVSDPLNGRVAESKWRRAMSRLEDSVINCPACGSENFFDPQASSLICWSCRRELGPPMKLVFGDGYWIALSEKTRIWRHHVDRLPTYDFELPIAEITRHPANQDIWGLANVGAEPFQATPPDGQSVIVQPGRSFGLIPGTVFQFEQTEARLEY